jgi:hypothetical protein
MSQVKGERESILSALRKTKDAAELRRMIFSLGMAQAPTLSRVHDGDYFSISHDFISFL